MSLNRSILFSHAAGLRVSELVSLKIKDIDSKRMVIFLRAAKGKKDRVVPLSKKLLEVLRDYVKRIDLRTVFLKESKKERLTASVPPKKY